jgi:uncharacterized protein YnzC (UPF0291/DUF896 family)
VEEFPVCQFGILVDTRLISEYVPKKKKIEMGKFENEERQKERRNFLTICLPKVKVIRHSA